MEKKSDTTLHLLGPLLSNYEFVKPLTNLLRSWETTTQIRPTPTSLLQTRIAGTRGASTTTSATAGDIVTGIPRADNKPTARPNFGWVPMGTTDDDNLVRCPANIGTLVAVGVLGEIAAATKREGFEGGEVVRGGAWRAVRITRVDVVGGEVAQLREREGRCFLVT